MNNNMEQTSRPKDTELWQTWRHKTGNGPILLVNAKSYLKYHVRGSCFEDCTNKASHCTLMERTSRILTTLSNESEAKAIELLGRGFCDVLPRKKLRPDKIPKILLRNERVIRPSRNIELYDHKSMVIEKVGIKRSKGMRKGKDAKNM